jgi:hypothetical protein
MGSRVKLILIKSPITTIDDRSKNIVFLALLTPSRFLGIAT